MKYNFFFKIFSKFSLKLEFGRIANDTLLGDWNAFNNNNKKELLDEAEVVTGGYGYSWQPESVTTAIEDEAATGVNQLNFTVVASDKGQAAPYADVISQVEKVKDDDVTQLAILSRVPVLDHVRASERNPVFRAILTLVGESPDSIDPIVFMLGFFFAQWRTLLKLETLGLRNVRRAVADFDLAHAGFSFIQMLRADHRNQFPIVQTCAKHQHEILASFVEIEHADHYIFEDNEHYYYISWVTYDIAHFLITRPETANAIREVRANGSYILTNTANMPLADFEHLYGMLAALNGAIPCGGFETLGIDANRPPRVMPLIAAAGDLVHGGNRLWDYGHVDAMYGRVRDFMYRHKKLEEFELVMNMGLLATQRLLPKTHEESRIIPALRVQLRRVCFVAPVVANKYVNSGMGVDAQALINEDTVKSFLTAPTAFAKLAHAASLNLHAEHQANDLHRNMWRGVISLAAQDARLISHGVNLDHDAVWECAGTTDFKYAYYLGQRRYDARSSATAIKNSESQLPRPKGWTSFWNSNICIYPSGIARNVDYHVVDWYIRDVNENHGVWEPLDAADRAAVVQAHNATVVPPDPNAAPLDVEDEYIPPQPVRPQVIVGGVVLPYGPADQRWTGNERYADYYRQEDNVVVAHLLASRRSPVATWGDTQYIIDKTIHCRSVNEVNDYNMGIQEYLIADNKGCKTYYVLAGQDQQSNLPVDNFLRFSGYGRISDQGEQLVFRTKKNLVTICNRDYVGPRRTYNVRNGHETYWPDEPNYGGCRAFDHFIMDDAGRSEFFYRFRIARLGTVLDKNFAMAHSHIEEVGPAPYDFDDEWEGPGGSKPEPSDFVKVEDSQTHTTGDAQVNETAPEPQIDGGDVQN